MAEYGVNYTREGHLGIITMNRPERLNTFNTTMFASLEKVIPEVQKHLPRVLILAGAGGTFSAGFDVNPDNPYVDRLSKALTSGDHTPVADCIYEFRRIIDALVNLPVPIIAALDGKAYGGGAELASRCDIRVMDPDAEVCFAEVRLGLMPDWGGGATLAALLGPAKAADLILTARKIDAREAEKIGFINRISPPGKVLDEAKSIAGMIAENGPRSVRYALEVIRKSTGLTLAENLAFEAERAISLISSGECLHGIGAFLMKKKPEFPDMD
ncbi:MAG: enoyl-CoA hydratase/isomerase family protein [Pseudomonadota bacterium]